MESKADSKARKVGNFLCMFFYISAFLYIAGMVVLSIYATTVPEYGVLLILMGAILVFATSFGILACALAEEFGIIKKALKIECPEE